ncbi:hypothetical protein FISHEDRAFT_74436 [Fistulina hepatica ATCC 64428]|uniref:Sucraseferredoxin-like protein n=1 Tax=Fistulina hepatica ATCC 64428 TaxID=1128425 RepID=A0A0D7A9E6_9AGAR|nr:hypothetical protein FISHEDRAFT_74436 [Fistulina hepatica ATCC 64428]
MLAKRALSLFSSAAKPKLAGTVPLHQCYIFLHSHQPVHSLPARVSSDVQRALQLRAMRWGGIVNFVGATGASSTAASSQGANTHAATVFARSGRLDLASVSVGNLDSVEARILDHIDQSPQQAGDAVDMYVCTHGSRDCRCGDTGGVVCAALRAEIAARKLSPDTTYAANALVFPSGDWFGELTPAQVPLLLDEVLAARSRTLDHRDRLLLKDHWRGRLGMSKEEQVALYLEQ